jgi:hypothetical protein
MRRWTILAAAALSLAAAGVADARPRFGPGMILRALPGPFAAMFGGSRSRHVRRVRTERPPPQARQSPQARLIPVRDEQTVAQGAGRGAAQDTRLGWTGPVFWPSAFDDMFAYASRLDGAGGRFWSYGYGDVLAGMFTGSAVGQPAPEASGATDACGAAVSASGADRWIERVEQALQPTAEQRPALEQLRGTLADASDRIRTTCRSPVPTAPLDRLQAMQDRLWAMRDATLTMRVPLERLLDQLTDEQKARLNGTDPGRDADAGAPATVGRADASARACSAQTPTMAGGPIEAIGRVVRPTEQQRAGLEALQMTTMGMAQLVMASCPAEQPAGPVARLGVETERITFMLFAVKTTGAAFSSFYSSLSDEQKAAFDKMAQPQQ